MGDIYSKIWDFEKVSSQLQKIWENIWNNRSIKLKEKEKICIKEFFEKIVKEYSQFSFVISLKLLKILKENLKELNEFSKQKLVKVVDKKLYHPNLSDEFINELYKKILSIQSFDMNILNNFKPRTKGFLRANLSFRRIELPLVLGLKLFNIFISKL